MKTFDFTQMALQEIVAKVAKWKNAVHNLEQQISELQNNIKLASEEIAWRKKMPVIPRVSDHAVLRYLERVRGMDTEAVRSEILTRDVADAIKAGMPTVVIAGMTFVIQDDCLVTVLSPEMRPKKVA